MVETTAKSSRIWRWTNRGVALVAAIWLAHWAYVRLTTPAMTFEQAYARFGPFHTRDLVNDATDAVIEIIAALPVPPAFDETAPEGMHWEGDGVDHASLDLTDMLHGGWTPTDRPYLHACLRYVTAPEVEAAVARLHALRGRPLRVWVPSPLETDGIRASGLRALAKLHVGRARYFLEETGDAERAGEELETTLWLARETMPGSLLHALVGIAIEQLVLSELMHMLQSHRLPEATLMAMRNAVDEQPNTCALWRPMMHNERILVQCAVAQRFADTPDGNGWLILSEPARMTGAGRSRLWDLLTVFHNRFEFVNRKIVDLHESMARVGAMPYPEAHASLMDLPKNGPLFTALDGDPLRDFGSANALKFYPRRTLEIVTESSAMREAAITVIAIEHFYQRYGVYPEDLSRLVPAYVPAVPADPFCNGELHYTSAHDAYRLWSCGEDGINHQGVPRISEQGEYRREHDLLFTEPRSRSFWESELVPDPADVES
jgi:hypothetical protein